MPKYWVSVDLLNAILADYEVVVPNEELEDLMKKADKRMKELGLPDYVVDGDYYFKAKDLQNAKEIQKKVEQIIFELQEKKSPAPKWVTDCVEINAQPD